MKYYFIYKTINIKSGKIYIGRHSTNNLNDRYLGSGIAIKDAIKAYGKNRFKREILEFCSKENIEEKEVFWIKKLNAVELGYNLNENSTGGNLESKAYKERFKNKFKCPYCGKESYNKPMMYNLHFDHCLDNVNIDINKEIQRRELSNKKRKESEEEREFKICKWCGYTTKNYGVFGKQHGDNCKQNPNYVDKRIDIICPHCGKIGKVKYMMERYHFDNCKLSPLYTEEKAKKRACSEKVKDLLIKRNSSKEYRDKISKKLKGKTKPKFKCIYCNKYFDAGNLKQWHNENCKLNPNKI